MAEGSFSLQRSFFSKNSHSEKIGFGTLVFVNSYDLASFLGINITINLVYLTLSLFKSPKMKRDGRDYGETRPEARKPVASTCPSDQVGQGPGPRATSLTAPAPPPGEITTLFPFTTRRP